MKYFDLLIYLYIIYCVLLASDRQNIRNVTGRYYYCRLKLAIYSITERIEYDLFCVTLTMLKIVPRSIDHTRHVLYTYLTNIIILQKNYICKYY